MHPFFILFALAVWQHHALGATSRSSAVSNDQDGSRGSQIKWGSCDASIVQDPTLSCGFFNVPLDYHDHTAGHARLALVKANATGVRRGTIFFNPGGPGGSGLESLSQNAALALALTGGYYDVVSWDPRGVGPLTTPGDVSCFDSTDEYNAFWNGTIQLSGIVTKDDFSDPADVDRLLSQAPIMQAKFDELARRCLHHRSGKFLRYIGTAATARDVATLADALDGPGSPINFIGASYGTLLGSWLVNMFPERVGRVVLDGVLSPIAVATEESPSVLEFHELANTDKVYEGFVTGCALAGPQGCTLASEGQSAADVNATIQALILSAYDAARKNASVPVTPGAIREAIFGALYDPTTWAMLANVTIPELATALKSAPIVNQTHPISASRRYSRRDNSTDDTSPDTGVAITCADSVNKRGTRVVDLFHTIISSTREVSPLFGSTWPAPDYYCPFWPVRAVERYQGPFNKTLSNKILVISNLFDPVTPLPEARTLVDLLGESATLVTQRGFGHTSFIEPSQCINAIAFAYFANGTLPEGNDTMCDVDADFEIFQGVNTEAILAAMGA